MHKNDFASVARLGRGDATTSLMQHHTLRKEFGSIINKKEDLYTASRSLRHKHLATTASTYVENRKKAAPDIAVMLAGRSKRKHRGGRQIG